MLYNILCLLGRLGVDCAVEGHSFGGLICQECSWCSITQQTQDVESIVDGGPTLNHYWFNVLCLLGNATSWALINSSLTLVHRLRHWTNIKPLLIQRLVSAGYWGFKRRPHFVDRWCNGVSSFCRWKLQYHLLVYIYETVWRWVNIV